MTIHDDARKASEAVYDAAISVRDSEIVAARAQNADLQLRLASSESESTLLKAQIAQLDARIRELETVPVAPAFRPVKFAGLDEARKALGAPADANYVVWKSEWKHLEQAFAAMGENDILVLPERSQPYLIDSSKGFMASGVKEVTGPNGTRTPVVSNSRLWFAMSRARRGILGLGPGVVIAPSESNWTAPAQPMPMTAYFASGATSDMTGSANKLIEADHANPFFANFELQGRDFGGVSYNGIALDGSDRTIKNILFNGCWRGFSAVPNGETGGLSFLKGTYTVDNCEFLPVKGPSPIMWNRTTGGSMSNVKVATTNIGMLTYWRCGGKNTWRNVTVNNSRIGMNLEENVSGFELDWMGGALLLESTTNSLHLNINPSGGSNKISLRDVRVTGAYSGQAGKIMGHVYTTAGKQRKSDVTWDGGAIAYLPESNWV